ncbi:MAG: lipoyl synthase [Deltaproteobacteria bacterium]|nr:lipoyl synthase [Deltaproteobacteria bacterium]
MINLADLCAARGIHVPSMEEVKQALERGFVEVFDLGEAKPAPQPRLAKPKWLKVRAPGSPEYLETKKIIKDLSLHTVCEEAHCPNIGECWSHGTATFMIMGDLCTRRCAFCAVKDGNLESLIPLDPLEPIKTARATEELGLKHVVITSVDRDDLKDMGAAHFNRTVELVAQFNPETKIELLIPDMRGKRDLVETILRGDHVSVLNHNVETVPRLYRTVRPGSNFVRSLNVLRWAKEFCPKVKTKSGLMVGLGENREEVLEVMDELRKANVDILTIGQYLQPTQKQLPVQRYVTPEEFDDYRVEGLRRGFLFVESGALVRSSYHAWKHTAEPEVVSAQ